MFKYITPPIFCVLAVVLAYLSPSGILYHAVFPFSHIIWSLLQAKYWETWCPPSCLQENAWSGELTTPNAQKPKCTWLYVPQRCFISHLVSIILKKDALPYLANKNIIQRIQMGFFPRKLNANHITMQMLINKPVSHKSCKGIFLRHRLK